MARYTIDQIKFVPNSTPWPSDFPKAVIGIDRDGVINEWKNVIKSPDDFIPIESSLQAIKELRLKGYKVVLIFDQPNIYKNKLTPNDVEVVNSYLMQLLGNCGCFSITGLYYNTSDMATDEYAKPNVGMMRRAERELSVNFNSGYYVGDTLEDIKMALRIGATPILVLTGKGKETQEKLQKINLSGKNKIKVFENLAEFASSME